MYRVKFVDNVVKKKYNLKNTTEIEIRIGKYRKYNVESKNKIVLISQKKIRKKNRKDEKLFCAF